MNFELWLQKIADFLVTAGVAAEDAPMAALALIYLVLTLDRSDMLGRALLEARRCIQALYKEIV